MFSAYMYNHYLSAASTFFALRRRFFFNCRVTCSFTVLFDTFPAKSLDSLWDFFATLLWLALLSTILGTLFSGFVLRSCKICYLLSVFKLKKNITMWMVHLVSNISNTYQQDTHLSPRYCLSWSFLVDKQNALYIHMYLLRWAWLFPNLCLHVHVK